MEIFLSHTYHDFYGSHKSPLYNLYHPFLTSPPFLRIKNWLPLFTKSSLLQAIFSKYPLYEQKRSKLELLTVTLTPVFPLAAPLIAPKLPLRFISGNKKIS